MQGWIWHKFFANIEADNDVESNRIMKQTKPIFICGLMGSGKSTVGRILASKIGVPFVDLDEEIERKAGKTVSEIFAGEGEARFRELERLVLMDCIENDTGVVALGGWCITESRNCRAGGRYGHSCVFGNVC